MTEPDVEPQPDETEPDEAGDETNPPTETPADPTPEEEAEEEHESEPPASVPDAPEPEGLSMEEWEARFSKTEKAFDTYTKRVTTIWEDDAVKLIPVNISPGSPPGFFNQDDAGRIPDDYKQPLMALLGMVAEVEYKMDRSRPACEKCDGKGKVATGSLVPDYKTLICDMCQGRGFLQAGARPDNGAAELAAVPVTTASGGEYHQEEDADAWGHPRLLPDGMVNPNYGKMPQYVDPQFP